MISGSSVLLYFALVQHAYHGIRRGEMMMNITEGHSDFRVPPGLYPRNLATRERADV